MCIMLFVIVGLVLVFFYFWVIDWDQLMVLVGVDFVVEIIEIVDVIEVDLDVLIKVVVCIS